MIQIIHADVMDGLRQIPDQSVQCVVTSPPYWGLRDYGVEGQIGLEKTPEEYVAKMVEVFREVRRVLRDDGTVWLNLGDCYATNGVYIETYKQNHPEHEDLHTKNSERYPNQKGYRGGDIKAKDMIGIPWLVAFALRSDGWYLRSDIIWSKGMYAEGVIPDLPNPMPESVTDRPTKSHEHVFLLTKKARYYYDADAVRETAIEGTDLGLLRGKSAGAADSGFVSWHAKTIKDRQDAGIDSRTANPSGKRNRRTVWEIATQPFPAAHFATFPEALVEPCIKAGTSERGCCSSCGAPWVRVVEKETILERQPWQEHKDRDTKKDLSSWASNYGAGSNKITTIDWRPSCDCCAYRNKEGGCWAIKSQCDPENPRCERKPEDTIPCVVLDPFGGSGTVGKVARDLNRKAILIELSADYIKIMRERLRMNEQLKV